jgi:hypothetical protein
MSLVDQFRALGVMLSLDGAELRYRARVGVLTPALRDVLADLKPLLIAELLPIATARPAPPVGGWGEAVAAVFQKLRLELTPPQQTQERALRESLGHAG